LEKNIGWNELSLSYISRLLAQSSLRTHYLGWNEYWLEWIYYHYLTLSCISRLLFLYLL